MKYRILETHPSVFYVQYHSPIFGWTKCYSRVYNTSLKEAQMELANIRRSVEWVPKVHPSEGNNETSSQED